MGTTALVSVDEYLTTSYPDGDRDYLDGLVVERNVGENRHSRIQGLIGAWLIVHYEQFWSGPECRVRITSSRYRVPDLTLITGTGPADPGPLLDPPFLVVEVLSPDDRADEMPVKIADYRACGVQYIWVVDPIARSGKIYTPKSSYPASDGVLRTSRSPRSPLCFIHVQLATPPSPAPPAASPWGKPAAGNRQNSCEWFRDAYRR